MNPQEQFRADMTAAGYLIVGVIIPGHDGEIPGVPCLPLELQAVTQATEIPVRIEQLGQGFVVYPKIRRNHHV